MGGGRHTSGGYFDAGRAARAHRGVYDRQFRARLRAATDALPAPFTPAPAS